MLSRPSQGRRHHVGAWRPFVMAVLPRREETQTIDESNGWRHFSLRSLAEKSMASRPPLNGV